MARLGKGLRTAPGGIRITLYRGGNGKAVYDKTHVELKPESKADVKRAEKIRDEIDLRLKLGLSIKEQDARKRQFWQVAQDYLDSVQVDPDTRSDYKSKLNCHVLPHIGKMVFEEITLKDLQDMAAKWKLRVSTKKVVQVITLAVFRYGGRPLPSFSVGKEQKPPVDRYTPQERDAVLEKLDGHALTFFTIFFGTGMRPGEIHALTWNDFDGTHFHVNKQVTRAKEKNKTKTYANRKVYVPEWVREVVNNHDNRLKGGRLFTKRRYDDYYDEWRTAHEKARVGAHRVRYRRPYTCRHTRAAELLSMGVLPAEAASQLGHSVALFLRTYSEFIEEYCKDRDLSRLEGITRQKPARTGESH